MKPFILDHMLKEEFSFPDPSFPIQFYIDDLHQWPDGQVPLHWHLRYEIFSAFKQEVMVQIGEKRLILLPGESILIGGGQLHGYSLTDSTRECLCPNIVFTENILAPLTSTIFQKYFYPILNDPSLPHIKLSQYIPWQKQMLLCLFRVYQFLAGDVIYAVPQLSTFYQIKAIQNVRNWKCIIIYLNFSRYCITIDPNLITQTYNLKILRHKFGCNKWFSIFKSTFLK